MNIIYINSEFQLFLFPDNNTIRIWHFMAFLPDMVVFGLSPGFVTKKDKPA